MGLTNGGCVVFSCCSGGGGSDVMVMVGGGGGAGLVQAAPSGGGGGGGGHTADPVSSESRPASLALILGARVLVGRPHGPIQIQVICLYAGRGGEESSTGMTLTGLSSSSSSAMVTSTTSSTSAAPSSPSLGHDGDNIVCLGATGYGHEPIPWMAQGGSR
jgi:hypothetical protein